MRFWLCLAAALAVWSSVRAAPPLSAFSERPRIEAVALSPSGDRFALVGKTGEKRRLVIRRGDGTAELAADLGEVNVSALHWADEDRLIVMTRTRISSPMDGVPTQYWGSAIVIDRRTTSFKPIFKGSKSVLDAVFALFAVRRIDGKVYAFVGGVPLDKPSQSLAPAPTYPDLYRVDLDTMEYERIEKAGPGRANWVIGPDGSIVAHVNHDARGKVQTLYAGPGLGRPLLSHATEEGKFSLDGLGRTADTVLFGDATSGDEVAREIRTSGSAAGEVLYTESSDLQSLRDPITGLMVGIHRYGGGGEAFIDPERQKRLLAAIKAFPGLETRLVSFTTGLDRMVIYTEGVQDSGTFWLVDIAKKSAKPIGDARPDIKPEDLGPVSRVAYKATDGVGLDGILTLPPGREPHGLPLVVMPHDLPQGPGDDLRLDLWAQSVASRGYAVFQPNYRGTLGYGETFRKLADGEVGRKMQSDISDGVAALAAKGVIDPKRVCILGSGYGGYAALAGVTLQKGVYRCAVSISGLSDLTSYGGWVRDMAGIDVRRSKELLAAMGPVEGEDLGAISPVKNADKADAPILLIFMEVDASVPVSQGRGMERALRRADKAVEYYVPLDSEKDMRREGPTRAAATLGTLTAVAAFLEKNNPPN